MLLSIIAAAQAKLTSASNDSKCSVLIAYTGIEGSACILDALLLPEEQLADFKAIQGIVDLLPQGLSVIGAYVSDPTAAAGIPKQPCFKSLERQELVTVYPKSGSSGELAWSLLSRSGTQQVLSCNVMESHEQQWLTLLSAAVLRCRLRVQLDVYLPSAQADSMPSASVLAQGIDAALQVAAHSVQAEVLALLPDEPQAGPRPVLIATSSSGTLASLMPSTMRVLSFTVLHSPQQLIANSSSTITTSTSSATGSCSGQGTAPVFIYQPIAAGAPAVCHSACVELDALAYVPSSAPLQRVHAALAACLQGQLAAARRVMLQEGKVLPVSVSLFLPPGLTHHVCIAYPILSTNSETNELKLIPTRKRLHAALGLPHNQPMLRAANSISDDPWVGLGGAAEAASSGSAKAAVLRLRDVHVTLPAPGISGMVATVSGSYEYYHYMQERVNDSGWGCAYRSCQTICSWFAQQRYTRKQPPTHRQMQEVLVRLGDKEASFIGSSNWIGAIELGYILDEYLGISCKVITVNRGADIPGHARELAAHFQSQGTPIMIGGGVLAYTLLGVAFNELSGETAFLILDPHYTGGEDLKKIHAGSWVAWKKPGDNAAAGGPLFVQDAFYNFLCPQRPNTV